MAAAKRGYLARRHAKRASNFETKPGRGRGGGGLFKARCVCVWVRVRLALPVLTCLARLGNTKCWGGAGGPRTDMRCLCCVVLWCGVVWCGCPPFSFPADLGGKGCWKVITQ